MRCSFCLMPMPTSTAESPNRSTPLMMAAMYGHEKLAPLLLELAPTPRYATSKVSALWICAPCGSNVFGRADRAACAFGCTKRQVVEGGIPFK